MRAFFLGTADGHTSSTRSHSGVLLTNTEQSLLLDCGAPAGQFLKSRNLHQDHPNGLWLSHMHSDHIGQFSSLIQSLWLRNRKAPLQVYAPEKVIGVLQDYLEQVLLFPELIGFPIDWHPITLKKRFQLGSLTLVPFATTHLHSLAKYFKKNHPRTCFDCFGVAIEIGGEQIVYSSDIGLPQDLQGPLQQPTRTLICELTHFPEQSLFEELALAAPIRQTLITHYPDSTASRQIPLTKLAKSCRFNSKIKIVKDGQSVAV